MAPTRLINTETLAFGTLFAHLSRDDPNYPRFVIISHRWEEQEMSYQEFLYFTAPESDRNNTFARILGLDLSKETGRGYAKVKAACSLAKERGYEWLWIDTCCINKDSSAELSEAINSMYEWYRDAEECWVYLSDVSATRVQFEDMENEFWISEWWHRGWTLQELLAPRSLLFWDRDWQSLNSKNKLVDAISTKTGVHNLYLWGDEHIVFSTNFATKMLWTRARKTSRVEDTAYCLLGICNIHLPLLYGEGMNAFRRLQEAYIAKFNDETIFAVDMFEGLLATRPSGFLPDPMMRLAVCETTNDRTFSMTQTGIRMCVSYLDMGVHLGRPVWAVFFNAKYITSNRYLIRLFVVVESSPYSMPRLLIGSYVHNDHDAKYILDKAYVKAEQRRQNEESAYKYKEVILLS